MLPPSLRSWIKHLNKEHRSRSTLLPPRKKAFQVKRDSMCVCNVGNHQNCTLKHNTLHASIKGCVDTLANRISTTCTPIVDDTAFYINLICLKRANKRTGTGVCSYFLGWKKLTCVLIGYASGRNIMTLFVKIGLNTIPQETNNLKNVKVYLEGL